MIDDGEQENVLQHINFFLWSKLKLWSHHIKDIVADVKCNSHLAVIDTVSASVVQAEW